jgi:hypothetical protein
MRTLNLLEKMIGDMTNLKGILYNIIMKNNKTTINQEIDKPKHYSSKSGRDVIEWCEDFNLMNNAYVFNIFKYLSRAGKKENNSELQDALKAKVYLDRYIDKLESNK